MADIEDQLAELKQQLAEEKESCAAAERAPADRAEEQRRQHEQTMQLLNQLMGKQGGGGAEEQKIRVERRKRRLSRVARSRILRHQHPRRTLLLIVLYPSRMVPTWINLARADKTETTVSTVSPLIHTGVEDLFELR